MSHDPSFDYRARCEELHTQLRLSEERNRRSMRDLHRAQTTTRMIRKLFRMEYMQLATVDLAGVFLDLVLESLSVNCAAVLRLESPASQRYEVLEARGFAGRGRRGLAVEDGAPQFAFAGVDDPDDGFAEKLRRLTGTRAVLWSCTADRSLALLLGNGRRDQAPGWYFDTDDRPMVEAAMEVFASVVERNRIEQKLAYDACHDELTGLPNRHAVSDVLLERIGDGPGSAQHFAVLCVDIDRFKLINDSLGHAVGDELIQAFAERLRTTVRPGDVVARLTGNEFVVLAEDIASAKDAELMSGRLLDAFREPFHVSGHNLYISASIGIAQGPDGYENVAELLRDADIALYNAKRRGGGRVRCFGADMHNAMLNRVRLESEMREALEGGQLRLFYQPIHRTSDRQLHAFEALLRWQHPGAGLITPDRFLDLIEETELGVSVGDWVLEQVARDMQRWAGLVGQEQVKVSLNVSEGQFLQADFFDKVARIVRRSGISPNRLCIELTERMLLESEFIEGNVLERLRTMGVSLAVDDFGTGYSSLGRLQKLPIDTLKIDRSFVDRVAEDSEHKAIVRTIISLARNLSMSIVAEGVESESQLAVLTELGCDYVQGYLLGAPMDRTAATRLLQRPAAVAD